MTAPPTTATTPIRGSVVAAGPPPAAGAPAHLSRVHLLFLLLAVAAPTAVVGYLWSYASKPLWHDEQWRAYFMSRTDDFWSSLHGSVALSAGWVAVEKISIAVFGNTETALRVPTVAFIVALTVTTYLAARRWVAPLPALLAAGLAGGNGAVVGYGMQLKPFVIDATAAVVAVLLALWLARPHARSRGRQLLGYLGLGLCTVVGTGAIFVVGPLLALDGWRALRGRRLKERLPGLLLAALVVAVHLQFFVRVQTGLQDSEYWAAQFLPHDGPRAALHFLSAQLTSFVPGIATSPQVLVHNTANPIAGLDPHFAGVRLLVAVALWVGVFVGTARGLRSPAGRTLLAAAYGALAATLLAAAVRQWPFGFVRPNLFLVPLLFLVAVLGWEALGRWVAGVDAVPGGMAIRSLAGLLLLACVPGVVLSLGIDAARVGQLHRQSVSGGGFGIGIRETVAYTRMHAGPDDLTVVVGSMPRTGWQYYADDYAGYPAAISARADSSGRTVYVPQHGDPQLAAALRSGPAPERVWVFEQYGTGPVSLRKDYELLRRHGFCPAGSHSVPATGAVKIFDRGACRPAQG